MSSTRVLMVSRHYWPHVSNDAGCRLAGIVEGMRRSGVVAEVMTGRYATSWPTSLTYREAPLHRPSPAPRGDWSMLLYSRSLLNELKKRAPLFDVLYADSMREEGAAVVEAARRAAIPSVVRFAGTDASSDAVWWTRNRSARRCRNLCLSANVLLASNAAAEKSILAAGGDHRKICRIDNGFATGPVRDSDSRKTAIQALADVNGDLFVPQQTRVLLSINRLSAESGIQQWIEALPKLGDQLSGIRVWIVGDGPARPRLYERIRDLGISGIVSMPGSFSDIDELLCAADVYIQPATADGMDYHVGRALASGIPSVLPEDNEFRTLLSESTLSTGIATFSQHDRSSLAKTVSDVLEHLPKRMEQAQHIRQALLNRRPFSEMINAHINLFDRLRTEAAPNRSTKSAQAGATL